MDMPSSFDRMNSSITSQNTLHLSSLESLRRSALLTFFFFLEPVFAFESQRAFSLALDSSSVSSGSFLFVVTVLSVDAPVQQVDKWMVGWVKNGWLDVWTNGWID
jgi:hypothetical protein